MNKQPARGVEVQSLPEDVIAEYLQRNPDFFERHAALLTRLKIPHSRGASTVSLVERQVLVLREKNEKVESRLHELIGVARDNDALANRIHRLSCRLIRARTAGAVVDALESSLREDFGASEWLILLAPSAESGFDRISSRHLRIINAAASELKMFETLFESGKPRCGAGNSRRRPR